MKKRLALSGLIFFLTFIFLPGPFFAADYSEQTPAPYAASTLKAFADSLYNEGFLSQAESQYKLYLFSFDFNSQPQVEQNLDFQASLSSLCNIYKSQQNKSGINWLKKNFYRYAQLPLKEEINLIQGKYIFMERKADDFEAFSRPLETESFSPDFSRLLKASAFVLNKDIQPLKELCSLDVQSQGESSNFIKLGELADSYKLKKPGAALFLSMLLPGSGKWYTGSFGAFTGSFLSIGSFIAGTVFTGIQTKWKSWQPYIFGACGLVLYIADLYGSYQSAKRYNDALYRHLCEETEAIYEKLY